VHVLDKRLSANASEENLIYIGIISRGEVKKTRKVGTNWAQENLCACVEEKDSLDFGLLRHHTCVSNTTNVTFVLCVPGSSLFDANTSGSLKFCLSYFVCVECHGHVDQK